MSQITLQLPDTLYSELETLAQIEGVQVTQYVLYALTRQVVSAYTIHALPEEAMPQQKTEFEVLLQRLGNASSTEIEAVLAKRGVIEPEPELSPEIAKRLQQRMTQKSFTHQH